MDVILCCFHSCAHLLPAKLVAWIKKDFELISKALVPCLQGTVDTSGCASSGSNVNDEHRFPGKCRHGNLGCINAFPSSVCAAMRVQRKR